MAELILRNTNGMKYSYAHTELGIQIEGAVTQPTAANPDGPVLFMPIVASKGRTNVLVPLLSGEPYVDFINEFGASKVFKNGQPMAAIEEHLLNGGRAVVVNLRPQGFTDNADNALVANDTIALSIQSVMRKFWVTNVGRPVNDIVFGEILADDPKETVQINEGTPQEPKWKTVTKRVYKGAFDIATNNLNSITNAVKGSYWNVIGSGTKYENTIDSDGNAVSKSETFEDSEGHKIVLYVGQTLVLTKDIADGSHPKATDFGVLHFEEVDMLSYQFTPIELTTSGNANMEDVSFDINKVVNTDWVNRTAQLYTNKVAFPATGVNGDLYLDETTRLVWQYDSTTTTYVEETPYIIPIISMGYVGVGKYGNNYQVILEKTTNKLGDKVLFNFIVYDTNTSRIVEKFMVTQTRDAYLNGIPMNIGDVIKNYSKTLQYRDYTDDIDAFNTMFIEMTGKMITQLNAKLAGVSGSVMPLVGLAPTITYLSDIKKIYEDVATDIPALDLFEIWTAHVNPIFKVLVPVNATSSYTYTMNGGTDGWLSKMNKFDFEFKHPTSGKYVLSKMYQDVFTGLLPGVDSIIYDTAEFPVDYMLDIDFDLNIKMAMNDLSLKRPDIPLFICAPTATESVDMLKTYVKTFNPNNRNICFMINTFEKLNLRENKPYRIGLPQGLISTLITHFLNGYVDPVAGKMIPGIIEGSVLPKLVKSDDLQWAFDNNLNYLTKTKSGYMLDGQAGNMKGVEHPYKEIHNQLIVGRIMKDIIDFLITRRHLLDKPEVITQLNNDIAESIVKKYSNKISISYKLYYKNDYEKKIGTLTDEFVINGTRTIKRHDVILRMVNQ